MRPVEKQIKLSRRRLLGAGSATLVAMTITPTGIIVGAESAWAAVAKAIKPQTFATLVQMARDIYPHDRISDKYYAKVIEGMDAAAAKAEDEKAGLEAVAASLNQMALRAHRVAYAQVDGEADRFAILRGLESTAFFQKIRSSLIIGIYNNRDLWPVFGYEGESASKGGYINRGFDDIDWLDKV